MKTPCYSVVFIFLTVFPYARIEEFSEIRKLEISGHCDFNTACY
jgi:hypothetical protein